MFKQVIQVACMPYAIIRVSDKSIDLAVSFDPPSFSFKRDNNSEDDIQLVQINTIDLTQANQNDTDVTLVRSGEDLQTLSLNVRNSVIGSHLFKVDLTGLELLKEDIASERQIDAATVKGVLIEPVK